MNINKFIPYGQQSIDENDINEVVKVLKSDYLTTGPKIKEFEDVICNYIGCKYAVVFSNGTAALHGAIYAAGIKEGDEVITSPLTFAASANCALYVGAKPIFADIDEGTFNIDYIEVNKKITDKTKAIVAVDFTGQSVDIDRIRESIEGKDIVIIQDAAHSLGTKYKGDFVGNIADMTMFSFHPVKTITTGEGGAIVTNNENFYSKLLDFRSHGITRDRSKFINEDEGPWYYEQQFLGYNYRMTDIQAVLGISQMKKLDRFISRRKEIVNVYNKAFSNNDLIILQKNIEESDTVSHLYVLRFDFSKLGINRRQLFEILKERNIGVNVHYIPVYLHPYYQELGYEKGICPISERVYESMITLPLHPNMSNDDVDYVIENLLNILDNNRK